MLLKYQQQFLNSDAKVKVYLQIFLFKVSKLHFDFKRDN